MIKTLCVILTLGCLVDSCSQRPKRPAIKASQDGVGRETVRPGPTDPGAQETGDMVTPVPGPTDPAAQETGDMATPAPGLDLVWKRYRAFEHGLTEGLGLKKETFCLELGTQSCIDKTHLTVLGGNEPYKAGQYERAQAPTVLTAIAVDRVVLSACSQRLELDRKAGTSAVVFKHFALTGARPDSKALEAQATELYQRILARNPEASELKVVTTMGSQGLANDKLALMLCYAIASSSENILL